VKDWQEFERLAQQIQSDLAPEADVTRNEKLRGKSGVEHQCDLVLRSKVGQLDFVCVVECKDKRAKVNLEIVRAFASRLQDLSASQGIIVASKGFTRDALRYAKSHGILPYTLFDAKSVKWSKQALVPLVVGFVSLKEGGVEFTNSETGNLLHFDVRSVPDWEKLPLLDTLTNQWTSVKVYLEHKWDEYAAGKRNLTTDTYRTVDRSGRYELWANKRRYKVLINYWVTPSFMWCYNRLPLIAGSGFVDHASCSLLLASGYDARIELRTAYEQWPHVERIEDLPYRGIDNLLFRVICFYHRAGTSSPNFPDAIEFGRPKRTGASQLQEIDNTAFTAPRGYRRAASAAPDGGTGAAWPIHSRRNARAARLASPCAAVLQSMRQSLAARTVVNRLSPALQCANYGNWWHLSVIRHSL